MMKESRRDFREKQRDVAFTTELMCESMIDSFDGVLWTTIDSPLQIPLFQAIYGQYILSFGRGERWEDWQQDGCFENREAEAFNWGYQLGWHVGTPGGSGNFELQPEYIQRSEFFKELASAREAAIDYVVFGEMMKPLDLLDVPRVDIEGSFKVFHRTAVNKPVLYSSVWKNRDGEIAICLVNSSREPVTASFILSPAHYGSDLPKKPVVQAVYPPKFKLSDCNISYAPETSRVLVPGRSALVVKLAQN
jgi:hypothetical protein